MAPRKDSESLEGSTETSSKDTTSTAGSSAVTKTQNGIPNSTPSSPAILEPSEDDPLFKREIIKRPSKTYRAIMRSFNSTEIYVNSDESSNDGENSQQMGGCHCVCIDIFNRYKDFAAKVRNSKIIYIIQILLSLLPISALVMGQKYTGSCPGSPTLTDLTTFTGIISLILIGQWMAIRCCGPEDRPCEGQQNILILLTFVLVTALLELEIYQFSKVSPSVPPSDATYCNKIFYDYTYSKFIGAFMSMLFVVLLYLPDYRNIASGIVCSDPIAGGCYTRYMEMEQ